jgi:hypothetical protein
VIRVDEQYDVGLAELFAESMALVGQRGGVDDGGRDVVWRAERGRDGDLGEDGLDLGRDEDVFDERRDDGALADALIAAYTDSDWRGSVAMRDARSAKPASSCSPVAILGAHGLEHGDGFAQRRGSRRGGRRGG